MPRLAGIRITPEPVFEIPWATCVKSSFASASYSKTVARSALSKSLNASMTVESTTESSLDSDKRRDTMSNLVMTWEGTFLSSCCSIGSIGFDMVFHTLAWNDFLVSVNHFLITNQIFKSEKIKIVVGCLTKRAPAKLGACSKFLGNAK